MKDEHVACYDRDAATLARLYDEADGSAMYDAILEEVGHIPAAGRALDVGAGSGRDARWMLGLGYEVTAVEPSVGMRMIAMSHASNGGINWIDDRLPELHSIPDASQDLVLLSAVWQHVEPALRNRAFATLLRVLAPEGILSILTRHGPAPAGRPMYAIERDEMCDHAHRNGLRIHSDTPLPDVLGSEGVDWVLWIMRARRQSR